MYKKAAQLKIRFPIQGVASVEDLFDLGLVSLDNVYRVLKNEERRGEDSLLKDDSEEDEVLALQLSIIEDVFQTKQAEIEARKAEADRKVRKHRIMEIIADKQDAELMDKSLDDLQAMIDAL